MPTSSSSSDHYKVLGLNENASPNDVKKAYKQLAKEWHPDKNLDIKDSAEMKFKEIAEANRVLSDRNLRREYDRSKERERQERDLEVRRNKKANIQRMAREQEDYVRKQEAKRKKARQMRAAYDNRGDETDEEKFSEFFNDGGKLRSAAPDLYSPEGNSLNRMMKDFLKMSSSMTFGRNADSDSILSFDLRKMQKDVNLLKKRQSRLEDQLRFFKSTMKSHSYLYDT